MDYWWPPTTSAHGRNDGMCDNSIYIYIYIYMYVLSIYIDGLSIFFIEKTAYHTANPTKPSFERDKVKTKPMEQRKKIHLSKIKLYLFFT